MVASVDVQGLSFRYSDGKPEVLRSLSLAIESGSRLVLVGANGAGKSTLLSVLAGQHMAPEGVVSVLGQDAFRAPRVQRRVALVAGDWSNLVATLFSTSVKDLFASAISNAAEDQREETERRGRRLLSLLGVEDHWTVGSVSEGQRRRIQLVLKLMPPHDLCLLDEATTDLDIIARRNLLLFLLQDSVVNGTTVVYCTHIFDGIDGWATHLALLDANCITRVEPCTDGVPLSDGNDGVPGSGTSEGGGLYALVKTWLKKGASQIALPTLPPLAKGHERGGGDCLVADSLVWGFKTGRPVLKKLSCKVPSGSRVVVTGANGAGKSTLLAILAGLRLLDPPNAVTVLGKKAFEDFKALGGAVSLLSQEWRQTLKTLGVGGSLSFSDLAASETTRLAQEGFPEEVLAARLAHLIAVLEVDTSWQPGRVSDGQLRRMQLAVKLMAPRPIVLLDEVSVDLDVIARDALLTFLRSESIDAGVTVVYCTHILDGLQGWASHHLHIAQGIASVCGPIDAEMAKFSAGQAGSVLRGGSGLYLYVQQLLWEECHSSTVAKVEEEDDDEDVYGDLSILPRVVKGGDELPVGWRVRQSNTPGAYGNAKWNPKDVRSRTEVSPAVADTAMDWLPTTSEAQEPRWVAVARTEREEEARRLRAVVEQREREAAERVVREAAEAAVGVPTKKVLTEADKAMLGMMEAPMLSAVAALEESLKGLKEAISTRDGDAFTQHRATAGRLWGGMTPALEKVADLIGTPPPTLAPLRQVAPDEDDAMTYSELLQQQGSNRDEENGEGGSGELPWGLGGGGASRGNQIAPDALLRAGRLVPERGEAQQ